MRKAPREAETTPYEPSEKARRIEVRTKPAPSKKERTSRRSAENTSSRKTLTGSAADGTRPLRESTREEILKAAEKLFATEGLDAVSTRRIAQQAGQRNNSALQYHFGSRDALLAEIVASRMAKINERRQTLLEAIDASRRSVRLADFVAVLVVPFVEQLLDGDRGRNYVRIAAQIFARSQGPTVFGSERPWNEAFYATLHRIRELLPEVPRATQNRRFSFLAGHLVQACAAADVEWGQLDARARTARARALADDLVDYSTGALAADKYAAASSQIGDRSSEDTKRRAPRHTDKKSTVTSP